VGRKMPASSIVSSTALRDGEFLEITLGDGSRKRIYDVKEIKLIRKDQGNVSKEA